MTKKTWLGLGAAAVVIALVVGLVVGFNRAQYRNVVAYFPSLSGVYTGDAVRVLGVRVGQISEIEPRSGDVKMTMRVKRDVALPQDVRAVVVAQSLVSGRFVQLTPTYEGGPELSGDADIPMDRTAVPIEWDEVKEQLDELTAAIGPTDEDSRGTAAAAIEVFDENLDGSGEAINQAIEEMSRAIGTMSDGRGDLFATVRSLQQLTEALSGSHEQLVQFNGRIASVSSVLADNTTELDEAMVTLSQALDELQNFIDTNDEAIIAVNSKLADTTGTLRDKDEGFRGLLHSAPTQLSNFYNIYNPLTGGLDGVFGLGMGANLVTLLCGTMASVDRVEISEADIEDCVDVVAPIMGDIVMRYPPFLTNPVIGRAARPDQITYQNADVRARAQAGVRERDAITRDNSPGWAKLLVPYGGDGN